jgi:hypothetical protein
MKADDLKLRLSYGTAVLLAIGGAVGIFALLLLGRVTADVAIPVLSAWVGAAVGFLFGQESATRAVKEFEKGLNTPSPPAPPDAVADTTQGGT